MNKRRHDLEENELASFLGKQIGTARENPDDLRKWAIPALVIVIGLCGAWIGFYLYKMNSEAAPGAWLSVIVAVTGSETPEQTRDALEKIAETPNEPAALWARQMRADSFLQEGTAKLFSATASERKEGQELLKSAQSTFADVRAKAQDSDEVLLLRRATFGEAQAWESLSEPGKAIDLYAELADEAGDTAVGDASRKRLSFLARRKDDKWVVRDDVASFLEEFKTYTPVPPPAPGGTGLGQPPVDPAADVRELTPSPDLSFPGMEEFVLPPGGGTGPAPGGDFEPGASPLPLAPPLQAPGSSTPDATAPEETSPEGTPPAEDSPEATPEAGAAPAVEEVPPESDDAAPTSPGETPSNESTPEEPSVP